MTTFKELLFVTDDSDTATTVQCYDLQLGVRVMTYKNGRGVARKTLSFVGEEYVVTAEASKPFLHLWSLNKEDPVKRMSVPGRVTALAVSPDGIYCAAGIESKIYVWNVPTGQLLNVVSYHHEPITGIVFWNCCYLITSAADGLVAVWRLVDLVSKETGDVFAAGHFRHTHPFFSSSHHSLPVTDVHLASSGTTARLFTVSADQTCQIFSLGPGGGKFLLTITFDYVLSSVVVDRLQRRLFVGTDCGKIVCYPLEPSREATVRHVDSSNEENALIGHSGSITSLCLSREDTVLASGSEDKKAILWNLSTGQQMGVYQTFGSVTDLSFRLMTEDFLAADSKRKFLVSVFERTIVSEPENVEIKVLVEDELIADDFEEILSERWRSDGRSPDCLTAVVPVDRGADTGDGLKNSSRVDEERESEESVEDEADCIMKSGGRSVTTVESEVAQLRQQNRLLKKINRRLYMYALDQCWQKGHVRDKPRC